MREPRRRAGAPDDAAIAAARAGLPSCRASRATRLVLVDGRFIAALSDRAAARRRACRARQPPALRGRRSAAGAQRALAQAGVALRPVARRRRRSSADRDRPLHRAARPRGRSIRASPSLLGAGARASSSSASSAPAPARSAMSRPGSTSRAGARVAHVALIVDDAPACMSKARSCGSASRRGVRRLSACRRRRAGAPADFRARSTGARREDRARRPRRCSTATRHADTTLDVDHAAPHGESREFYRHIVADEATGVFRAR